LNSQTLNAGVGDEKVKDYFSAYASKKINNQKNPAITSHLLETPTPTKTVNTQD
jgi:hypothetical protein